MSKASMARITQRWIVTLLLTSFLSHGPSLHAHQFDHHEPQESRTVLLKAPAADHSHVKRVHSVLDFSHNDHHDAEAGGWDLVSDFLLKVAISILAATLLFATWCLLFGTLSAGAFVRLFEKVRAPPSLFLLARPTRAPPQ